MNAFDDGRYIDIDTPVGARSAFPWFPGIAGCAGEFPRTDDRRATRGYRFGLINLTHVPGQPAPPDGIPGFRWPASVTYPEDPDGPDALLTDPPRLWPDTTTFPFHYRHPVTGKEV